MKTLTARDVCSTDYFCVASDGRPREILDKIKDRKIAACAVFDNSTFLGLVDFKDILQTNPQRIFADLLPPAPPPPVQEQAAIEEISRLLDQHPGSVLPVFDTKECFVGVVSQESLLQVLLEKHNHHLKLVEKVKGLVDEMNSTLDLKPILRAALRKILEILGLKTGWILLYDHDKSAEARLATRANLPTRYLKKRPAVLTGRCSCQLEIVQHQEKSALLCLKGGSGLKYHIAVPLVSSGKLFGIMNLVIPGSAFSAGQEEQAIANEEVDLLTTLGKSIGTAVMNAQSFHQLEADRQRLAQQSQRLDQLHKASTHLLSLLGTPIVEERLLQEGIESICQLVGARCGAVGLMDSKGQLLNFFHTGLTQKEKKLLRDIAQDKGILGITEGENRTLRFRDLTQHPCYSGFPPHQRVLKSFLSVPISVNGQVYGRIYLAEKAGGQPFTRKDEKAVLTFARSLALGLENAQLVQKLRLSETRYRTLFEEAPVMYVVTRNQVGGPIVADCNELFLRTLDYTRDEVLERPLADFYTPESRARLLEGGGYQQALEGRFVAQERQLLTRDGAVVETLLRATPETDSEGHLIGTRSMYVDITERKQMEERIHRYEDIFQTIQIGLVVWRLENIDDLRTFRLIAANPAATAVAGIVIEDFLGKTMAEAFPALLETEIPGHYAEVVRSGKIKDLGEVPYGEGPTPESVFSVKAFPLPNNCVGVAFENITERKQAEELLRHTNERLNLTLDNLTIVAYEIDSEGRWLLSRGKGLEKMGRRPDEVLGKSIFDHYKDKPAITEAVRKALEGQPQQIEVEIDGLIWSASYAPVVGPSGKIERVYGTAIDITERKRAEEVLKIRALQQSVVAELGQYALEGVDLRILMGKAVNLAAQTLGVKYSKVLELLPEGDALLLRAGVGWKEGYVGHATVGAETDSQAGFTLLSDEPVLVDDLRIEPRFSGSPLLHDHGVVGGLSVIIGGKDRPFGVLGVHTNKPRKFTKDDINFVQAIANALALAIERKRAEEALQQSEVRFAGILEIAPEAIISIDDAQKIVLFNKGAEQTFGYSSDEAVGQSLDFLLPEKFRATHHGHVTEFARSATNSRRMGERRGICGRRKSGEEFPAEASISKLEVDGERIFTVMLRDVTERKRAEQALKDSEEQYHQLVERVPDGIYRSTPEGQFLAVNSALVEMLGYDSQDELLKINIPRHLYFSPEERNEVLRRIKGGKGGSNIYRLKKKDGRALWVEDHGRQVVDTHGGLIYEGVLRDISERKKLEEQLRQSQKLEAVGQLTGGIAHDFNNLLTVILGNVEFGLQDSKSGDPVYQDLTRIEKAGFQARDLISQLLSFSRRQMLEPQVLNLNRTVKDLFKMLTRIIGEDIELKIKLGPKLAPIWADPVHIQQVLMNLFINARDAMPKGGQLLLETRNVAAGSDVAGELSVSGSRPEDQSEAKGSVEITITDSGHGMDKETQARIFEPFFSTKEVGKGTGLGLSVVYGIVKQHGGQIEVFSELGSGTTFKLYFPAASQPTGSTQEKAQLESSLGGTETILLVEDDEAVRTVAFRILRKFGYDVLMAEDGMQAVEVFEAETQNIDAVILDVVMPQMSGPDLYRNLSSIKPGLPVVFATGYDLRSEIDDLVRAAQAPVRVLRKPYNRDTLGQKVREILD